MQHMKVKNGYSISMIRRQSQTTIIPMWKVKLALYYNHFFQIILFDDRNDTYAEDDIETFAATEPSLSMVVTKSY